MSTVATLHSSNDRTSIPLRVLKKVHHPVPLIDAGVNVARLNHPSTQLKGRGTDGGQYPDP